MIKAHSYSVFCLLFFLLFKGELVAQNRQIDSLKLVLEKQKIDTTRIKTIIALSHKILKYDAEISKSYANKALELSKTIKNDNKIADSYVAIGKANQQLGKFEEAIENYENALFIFKKQKNRIDEARVLNNIGYSKMSMGEYKIAVEYYLKSLEINKVELDSLEIGSCYTRLAIVFAVKGDYKQAEKYFTQAAELYKLLKDDYMYYKNMLNLCGVYKDQGAYQKSIQKIQSIQAYYIKTNSKDDLARCQYILGCNYEELKDFSSALEEFTKAIELYKIIKNKEQVAGCKLKLASIHTELKNYPLALKFANECLLESKEMNAKDLMIRCYSQLSHTYTKLGQYEKAYNIRIQYENLKDSVFNEENNSKILEMEAKYQNKLKEKEIKALQAKNTIDQLEIKKQTTIKFILAGLILFISIISLMLFNQYKIKNRSTANLELKNKIIQESLEEKEILLQEIHHRVKNNLQFVWSLLNLQSRHVKDKKTLETLLEGKNRIKNMSLIQQKLYQSNNLKGVDMVTYVPQLLDSLYETYSVSKSDIELKTDIDGLNLDIDTAMPLGLIMNELITNALKYAFTETQKGVLEVDLKRIEEELVLTVKDNGKGIQVESSLASEDTFGLNLVKSLAKQLKAEIIIEAQNGTTVRLNIKKFKLA